jgi:uncharacterized protein (DUF849 family)
LLIKACLNGNRRRDEHSAIPISPPELALEAHHAMLAGAGAVHVHPRTAAGDESLEPHTCAAAIEAIRRSCPGLPVGLTTGAWIEPDPERRSWLVARWDILPDFASVNASEDGTVSVAAALLRRGVGVEAGVAVVEDARRVVELGLGDRCLRILVEIHEEKDPQAAVAKAAAIDAELEASGVDAPQVHHGAGPATWAVIEAAAARGHDVRVGLEDTLVLPDGRVARDNAELVGEAVRLTARPA